MATSRFSEKAEALKKSLLDSHRLLKAKAQTNRDVGRSIRSSTTADLTDARREAVQQVIESDQRIALQAEWRRTALEQLRKDPEVRDLARGDLKKALERDVRDELRESLASQVYNDLKSKNEKQMLEKLEDEVRADLREELRGQLTASVTQELRKSLRSEVLEQLREQVAEKYTEEIQNRLRQQIERVEGPRYRNQLQTSLRADVIKILREELTVPIKNMLCKQLEATAKSELRRELRPRVLHDLRTELRGPFAEQMNGERHASEGAQVESHHNVVSMKRSHSDSFDQNGVLDNKRPKIMSVIDPTLLPSPETQEFVRTGSPFQGSHQTSRSQSVQTQISWHGEVGPGLQEGIQSSLQGSHISEGDSESEADAQFDEDDELGEHGTPHAAYNNIYEQQPNHQHEGSQVYQDGVTQQEEESEEDQGSYESEDEGDDVAQEQHQVYPPEEGDYDGSEGDEEGDDEQGEDDDEEELDGSDDGLEIDESSDEEGGLYVSENYNTNSHSHVSSAARSEPETINLISDSE